MDITESRLGVGWKLNHRLLKFLTGGVNALLTISLLARRLLGATISRLLFLLTKEEFEFNRRDLGEGEGKMLSKSIYFSTGIEDLFIGEG